MTKPAFTPGPWSLASMNDCLFIVDNGPPAKANLIAKLDYPQADSNAALISAAPDMLEALVRCEEMVSTDKGPPDWDWVRSIIAKALGAT